MLLRRLIPLACVAWLGCDPNSEPVGEGPETGGGSDSTTSADTSTSGGSTSATSGASMSATSVGDSTPPGETGSLDVGTDETTGGAEVCQFEPTVIDFAESGKVLPQDVVDCGSLPLGSEAQAYQETQDCILASSSGGLAYYAFIELQGIDSEVWEAYSGSPGRAFAEARWFYDNYQGGEQLWSTTCTPTPNGDPSCVPGAEIGLCLTCEGESVQVCPVG